MKRGRLSSVYAASRLFHGIGPLRAESAAYTSESESEAPHVDFRVGRPTPYTLACGGGGVFVEYQREKRSPSESHDGSGATSVSTALNKSARLFHRAAGSEVAA